MVTRNSAGIEVYLEIGAKRTFANAVEWPGWSRAGRDEDAALQALVESGRATPGRSRRRRSRSSRRPMWPDWS